MTRRLAAPHDGGSAVIEFIVIGVLVLVPVAYLGLAAAQVGGAAFAATAAVREAGRAFATAESVPLGRHRAVAAARMAFEDHGMPFPEDALRVSCIDGPCLTPGSTVVVDLSWSESVGWVPGPSIPIQARHLVPVDDLRADLDWAGSG